MKWLFHMTKKASLVAALVIGAQFVFAETAITLKEATAFFEARGYKVNSSTGASVEMKKTTLPGTYMISYGTPDEASEAYLVKQAQGQWADVFDQLAKDLISKKPVALLRKGDFALDENTGLYRLKIFTNSAYASEAWAFEIQDEKILSEVLRNITGYSRRTMQTTLVAHASAPVTSQSGWSKAWIVQDGAKFSDPTVIPALVESAAKVKVVGYGDHSPEFFDGNLAAVLHDPSQIDTVPSKSPEGTIKFSEWSMFLDALVIPGPGGPSMEANRDKNSLNIPRGPVGDDFNVLYSDKDLPQNSP